MFWKKARRTWGHLTAEDKDIQRYLRVSSDIQRDGSEGLVGAIHDLGHRWIAARTRPGRTLEIGSGRGRHRVFFRGSSKDYFPSEYSIRHLVSDSWKRSEGRGTGCDARRLPFRDGVFTTVISIYNLEHIRDLKDVFREVHRVLAPGGRFLIALPCEGGLFWNVGRELTTRPQFEKKYGINYDKAIAFEHVHDFKEVVGELGRSGLFRIASRRMIPFLVPTHHLNLIGCIDATAVK